MLATTENGSGCIRNSVISKMEWSPSIFSSGVLQPNITTKTTPTIIPTKLTTKTNNEKRDQKIMIVQPFQSLNTSLSMPSTSSNSPLSDDSTDLYDSKTTIKKINHINNMVNNQITPRLRFVEVSALANAIRRRNSDFTQPTVISIKSRPPSTNEEGLKHWLNSITTNTSSSPIGYWTKDDDIIYNSLTLNNQRVPAVDSSRNQRVIISVRPTPKFTDYNVSQSNTTSRPEPFNMNRYSTVDNFLNDSTIREVEIRRPQKFELDHCCPTHQQQQQQQQNQRISRIDNDEKAMGYRRQSLTSNNPYHYNNQNEIIFFNGNDNNNNNNNYNSKIMINSLANNRNCAASTNNTITNTTNIGSVVEYDGSINQPTTNSNVATVNNYNNNNNNNDGGVGGGGGGGGGGFSARDQNGIVGKNLPGRPLSAPQTPMTNLSSLPFNSFSDPLTTPTSTLTTTMRLKNGGGSDATLRRGQGATIRFQHNSSSNASSSSPSALLSTQHQQNRNIVVMPTAGYNNNTQLLSNGYQISNRQQLGEVRSIPVRTSLLANGSQKLNNQSQQQQRHCLQRENSTEFPAYLNDEMQRNNKLVSPLALSSQNINNLLNKSSNQQQQITSATSTLSLPTVNPQTTLLLPSKEQNGKPKNLSNEQLNGNTNSSSQKVSPRDSINGSVASTSSFISSSNNNCETPNDSLPLTNGSTTNGSNGTVVIRLTPEVFQQSALNITGGADCVHPAIISKIASGINTPLNEGDQVLRINNEDITCWTQNKVHTFLQKMRQKPKELMLVIKPNVYRYGGLVDDESIGVLEQCTSALTETLHVAETVPRSDKLAHSMALLKSMIEGEHLNAHFEQIYRKRPGASMDVAHQTDNLGKNRYRDVCPYDATRVRLKNSSNGNYINANNVNMEIKSSGIVNRYIATQGPLPHTTADFWWMVWEQSSTTIVMLTTLVEKGRVKCHQYWPECKNTFEFGFLSVSNVTERVEPYCCYRELTIKHKISREERRVTQMQYTAWPDHGVPENSRHFTKFVSEVRLARNGSIEPIIVHCSAGIGRTGVLIMMETAACMIEANEPVYPLDIMRTMRDQRAMLIQTIDQFAFVCESILRAYNERSVKPLAEYQQRG